MPRRAKAADPNAVLANIMLQERTEKIEKDRRAEELRQIRLKQVDEQDKLVASKQFKVQSRCDHLLGNHRVGVTPDFKRSALHMDHFSDKTVRIYCQKCRGETHPGDTAQFWYKIVDGARAATPNPWKKSWREMREFFFSFSNANDLTSRAFRIERVEPEEDSEEAITAA